MQMKTIRILFFTLSLTFIGKLSQAQVDENDLGAWYMYFFDGKINEGPWGFQGDVQFRNWNTLGDLEQLLLRGGLTYSPQNSVVKLTLGYGNVTTGTYGSSSATSSESRTYQEALFPSALGWRLFATHRFRYEQRWVENQEFRTRFRYNLFLNIPVNHATIIDNTVYVALYNELFVNGQRNIGNGNTTELFDRNRFYYGLGYKLNKQFKFQIGCMNQTTNAWSKNQLQLSVHHNF